MAKKKFGENYQNRFLELNASLERGVDSIRTNIQRFIDSRPTNTRSICFLDEIDSMGEVPQKMLCHDILPSYSKEILFIFACNVFRNIDFELQDKCLSLIFQELSGADLRGISKKNTTCQCVSRNSQTKI